MSNCEGKEKSLALGRLAPKTISLIESNQGSLSWKKVDQVWWPEGCYEGDFVGDELEGQGWDVGSDNLI